MYMTFLKKKIIFLFLPKNSKVSSRLEIFQHRKSLVSSRSRKFKVSVSVPSRYIYNFEKSRLGLVSKIFSTAKVSSRLGLVNLKSRSRLVSKILKILKVSSRSRLELFFCLKVSSRLGLDIFHFLKSLVSSRSRTFRVSSRLDIFETGSRYNTGT